MKRATPTRAPSFSIMTLFHNDPLQSDPLRLPRLCQGRARVRSCWESRPAEGVGFPVAEPSSAEGLRLRRSPWQPVPVSARVGGRRPHPSHASRSAATSTFVSLAKRLMATTGGHDWRRDPGEVARRIWSCVARLRRVARGCCRSADGPYMKTAPSASGYWPGPSPGPIPDGWRRGQLTPREGDIQSRRIAPSGCACGTIPACGPQWAIHRHEEGRCRSTTPAPALCSRSPLGCPAWNSAG